MIQTAARHLENNKEQITAGSYRLIGEQQRVLETNKMLLKLADPITILNKGFAMLWHNGKIVTSKTQLKEGDTIVNQLRDGEVQSQVLKTNDKNGRKE